MKRLMESMINDLRHCRDDEYGPHRPEYGIATNCANPDFDGTVRISIGFSKDPSRSNNGGEYFFYSRYRWIEDGRLIRETTSSYEDASWEIDWDLPGILVSKDTLARCAELARLRVLAEKAPRMVDWPKTRRRVEDALRKYTSNEDLAAIAALLGVKIS